MYDSSPGVKQYNYIFVTRGVCNYYIEGFRLKLKLFDDRNCPCNATSLYSGKGNYKYHGSEMFQIIIQSFY